MDLPTDRLNCLRSGMTQVRAAFGVVVVPLSVSQCVSVSVIVHARHIETCVWTMCVLRGKCCLSPKHSENKPQGQQTSQSRDSLSMCCCVLKKLKNVLSPSFSCLQREQNLVTSEWTIQQHPGLMCVLVRHRKLACPLLGSNSWESRTSGSVKTSSLDSNHQTHVDECEAY